MFISQSETAKQNQKFPFHFFFRFAAEGWGEETRGKCKEIFWFLHTRVCERVRGALIRITTQSERTRQFQGTTRSARAKWVRAKVNTSPHLMQRRPWALFASGGRDSKVGVCVGRRGGVAEIFNRKLSVTESLTLRIVYTVRQCDIFICASE